MYHIFKKFFFQRHFDDDLCSDDFFSPRWLKGRFGDPLALSKNIEIRYENRDTSVSRYRLNAVALNSAGKSYKSDEQILLATSDPEGDVQTFFLSKIRQLKNVRTGKLIDNFRRYLNALDLSEPANPSELMGKPISRNLLIEHKWSQGITEHDCLKVTNIYKLSHGSTQEDWFLVGDFLDGTANVTVDMRDIITARDNDTNAMIDQLEQYVQALDKQLEREIQARAMGLTGVYPIPH